MPRPGPRPYECVRKAWHSDRHQPIRGSLIQEIFRVVNEVHGSATKKNKEWQEKLPIVVLKAEEIMYSKANSEAEYMDLKTLWERMNDAIDTIIRRDDSTENGKLLQPCIEAALNLGCTPRRASRSQRNINPRFYLSPNTQEQPPCVSPGTVVNTSQGNHTTKSQYMPRCSNFVKPDTPISTHLRPFPPSNDCAANKSRFASVNVLPSGNKPSLHMENYPASNLYPVYPLYYGILPNLTSDTLEPAKMGVENPYSCNVDASYKITETDTRKPLESSSKIGCDLSLRLGPLSFTRLGVGNRKPQEVEDDGSGSSRDGGKHRDQSPVDRKLALFTGGKAYDPLDSCSIKCSFEDKNINVEATMRKRKEVFNHPEEDQQFCGQPKLPGSSHLTGRMRNAD